ncbi:hypothetical protein HDC91_002195 [Mucilaginibacter sp. AK015]|nr:hypothetical protein [Mucilaginibacter sp. AK015]
MSTGCKSNLTHAIAGVTVRLPRLTGASMIMLICTGKKAASMSMIPHEAILRVLGNIIITANAISKKPANTFAIMG